jgi:large subunit ribosomal protein L25
MITLPATLRDLAEKPRQLRKMRKIPAEFYGAGQQNLHLVLDYQTFRKILKEAGESTIINLKVENEDVVHKVLIHRVDYDPITDEFQHIDLFNMNMQKKIIAHVPIHLTGIAPAVKEFGGILTQAKNEIEIRCLPGDLIQEIKVNISHLKKFGSAVRIKDLILDREKTEILEREEVVVCRIIAPKTAEQVEEELAEPAGEGVSKEIKEESEKEKTAAQASKEGDSEKKGKEK